MRTRCILLAALLGAGALVAQDQDALANLKTAYEAKRAELTAARDATVNRALAAYQAELGALLTNVKQQGNLDYVLAIEAEQKRLETDASAPTEPAAKEFAHLRRVQWATRQTEDKADADLTEQSGRLRKQYMIALEKLEKDLVAANRIEEAKAARGEREAVEAGEAMCGRWMWLGQFDRIHQIDGTIWSATAHKPIGRWEYLGTTAEGRQYKVETHVKYVETVTMAADSKAFWWTDRGKRMMCLREDQLVPPIPPGK